MKRRIFIAASAATATAATAATLRVAVAATEGPFGETGVGLPVPPSQQLPLGPLPDSRYPDGHIDLSINASRAASARAPSSGSPPASIFRRSAILPRLALPDFQ